MRLMLQPHLYDIGDTVKAWSNRRGFSEGVVVGVELSITGVYRYRINSDDALQRTQVVYEDEIEHVLQYGPNTSRSMAD